MRSLSRKPLFYGLAVVAAVALALLVVDHLRNRVDSPLLQRLQGTWISDAEATLAGLTAQGQLSPEQIERLAPIFGKLTVTYKGNTVMGEMPPFDGSDSAPTRSTSRLTVLEEDDAGGRISFKLSDRENASQWSELFPEEMVYRIQMDGDGYWLSLEDEATAELPGFKERFKRLAPAE